MLNYTSHGNGEPVVLLHGMAASKQDWSSLLQDLAQAGFQGYAPDLVGHGDSVKPDAPPHYTARAVYNTFENWLESLALSGPLRLVGHSLGGFLSLLYAHRHPKSVASLVLIDPFISPRQLSPAFQLFGRRPDLTSKAYRHIPGWLVHLALGLDLSEASRFSNQVRQQIAKDYLRASPNIMYMSSSVWDLTPILPEINSPTLIIWGDHDQTLKPASFPRLALQLPHAEVYPVAHSGHQPHIGKADQVNRKVVDFFRRQPEFSLQNPGVMAWQLP